MTDSASDPKVEDVLSSVRRLVSGEVPRKTRTPLPKGPGALVLTQADRVEKDPLVRVASRSLEDRIAELEAAVDGGADEFEPDGSEDQAQNVPDRIVYTRPPSSEEEANMRRSTLRLSEIALIETGPANEAEDEQADDAPIPFRHGAQVAVQANDNGDEEAHPDEEVTVRMGDNGPPEGGPELEPFVDPSLSEPEEPASESALAEEAPMAEDVPTVAPRRAEVTAFTNPDDVVARIEARIDRGEEPPEAPIGAASGPDAHDIPSDTRENMLREDVAQDEIDPDADFDAALNDAIEASVASAVFEELADAGLATDALDSDVAAAPEDRTADTVEEPLAESETPSEPEEAAPEIPQEPAPEARSAPLPAIEDEDAMRLLVARLIRKELQGELGERITRNVRKLVRREIKRALDARDLI